jgi:hypothetical protein
MRKIKIAAAVIAVAALPVLAACGTTSTLPTATRARTTAFTTTETRPVSVPVSYSVTCGQEASFTSGIRTATDTNDCDLLAGGTAGGLTGPITVALKLTGGTRGAPVTLTWNASSSTNDGNWPTTTSTVEGSATVTAPTVIKLPAVPAGSLGSVSVQENGPVLEGAQVPAVLPVMTVEAWKS